MVIQGVVFPDDVFKDVVISNVCVLIFCLGVYFSVQVRSLADSDEVFESACDLNEVMSEFCVLV